MSRCCAKPTHAATAQPYQTSGVAALDLAVAKLSPIAAEMKRLTADEAYVDSVLIDGADRARAIASETMDAVKDIAGFVRKR